MCMKRTYHIECRMNQRGISSAMLDLLLAYGDFDGDKIYLNRKQALQARREIDFLLTRI